MIEIEEEFGPISLGHDEVSRQKVKKTQPKAWALIAQFLKYEKKDMAKFLNSIESAVDLAQTDYHQERKKQLELFLRKRTNKNNMLQMMQQHDAQENELLKIELN